MTPGEAPELTQAVTVETAKPVYLNLQANRVKS